MVYRLGILCCKLLKLIACLPATEALLLSNRDKIYAQSEITVIRSTLEYIFRQFACIRDRCIHANFIAEKYYIVRLNLLRDFIIFKANVILTNQFYFLTSQLKRQWPGLCHLDQLTSGPTDLFVTHQTEGNYLAIVSKQKRELYKIKHSYYLLLNNTWCCLKKLYIMIIIHQLVKIITILLGNMEISNIHSYSSTVSENTCLINGNINWYKLSLTFNYF